MWISGLNTLVTMPWSHPAKAGELWSIPDSEEKRYYYREEKKVKLVESNPYTLIQIL